MPQSIPNDVLKPSKTDEEKNELEIFGGKTHTVATKRSPVNARPNSAGEFLDYLTSLYDLADWLFFPFLPLNFIFGCREFVVFERELREPTD